MHRLDNGHVYSTVHRMYRVGMLYDGQMVQNTEHDNAHGQVIQDAGQDKAQHLHEMTSRDINETIL